MSQVIGQRELRNDNAEIMRRVESGERFTVTRNGKPVADLVPHQSERAAKRRTLGEAQAAFRGLPPMDAQRWRREREADDQVFGSDDPADDAWSR
ncbi:type II toxin-antitoxin system Phd/YefM family antitoxin [Actinokineospora xionganensis]|uniref:Antitoxin n=1 Tax=Actinokineospora xionganensis TaxID=2684470 RepID=A0ABR7L9W4_9PSEU|nr:type II toxin-antitoxin system prevent-host-death family antitoxin [Actinokineospora xionganensis]MBC6449462.1 type II toxin-antitoxin system prevent-host-death family antitoxin [Actinokineospora xionganensis]